MDDTVLTSNDDSKINKVKDYLKSRYLIKYLGKLKFFLGIEILDYNNGLYMS